MTKTHTRKQYLSGDCTHAEYYDQLVTESLKTTLVSFISLERIVGSTDKHFNDIPLQVWDRAAALVPVDRFKELGDTVSLSGCVCALKAAARQIRGDYSTTQDTP